MAMLLAWRLPRAFSATVPASDDTNMPGSVQLRFQPCEPDRSLPGSEAGVDVGGIRSCPWDATPPTSSRVFSSSFRSLDEVARKAVPDSWSQIAWSVDSASRTPENDPCDKPTGVKRFLCDSRALGRRLMLREPGDAYRALGIFGTAGALFAERNDIRDAVLEHRSSTRTHLYRDAQTLGKGATAPLIATALYVAGKATSNSYHTESAQILAESTLYAGILAVTGQFVLASERPEDGRAVHFFRRMGHSVSGDVAIAASVVAPLDRRYLRFRPEDGPGRKFLRVSGRTVLYAALMLTAMQRMDADKHWAPDVFLGAAAGLTAGYSICSAHEPARLADVHPRRPAVVPTTGGLSLVWSF
jgi:hypothetical protein